MKPQTLNPRTLALASCAIAVLALAACDKAAVAPQAAGNSAELMPAALPLDANPPAALPVAAPAASALPAAPRAQLAPRRTKAARYDYVGRATSLNSGFADSPPDYAVDYQGTRPSIWRSQGGAYRVVESTPDGDRYYYYDAGSDQPYLVRDPRNSYGYDQGRLAVIYDAQGRPLSDDVLDRRSDTAGRYLARAAALYAATQQEQHRAAYAQTWRARQSALADQQRQWDRARQSSSDWQAWNAQHAADEAAIRREADARRMNSEGGPRLNDSGRPGPQLGGVQSPTRPHQVPNASAARDARLEAQAQAQIQAQVEARDRQQAQARAQSQADAAGRAQAAEQARLAEDTRRLNAQAAAARQADVAAQAKLAEQKRGDQARADEAARRHQADVVVEHQKQADAQAKRQADVEASRKERALALTERQHEMAAQADARSKALALDRAKAHKAQVDAAAARRQGGSPDGSEPRNSAAPRP